MNKAHKQITLEVTATRQIQNVLIKEGALCHLYTAIDPAHARLVSRWTGGPDQAPRNLAGTRALMVDMGDLLAPATAITLDTQDPIPRRGRPNKTNPSSTQIHLRITPLEKADWQRKAASSKQPLSTWIKSRCSE